MNGTTWLQAIRQGRRALLENPVYRREKGDWGKPNPFYDNLSRFSPFVVMGAIFVGACAGGLNPALLDNNELTAFWCLLCLPNILVTILTLFGAFMAPALTAPTISLELDRGTWDVLRTTPLSTRSILLAKLFGALARLRIWRLLFALSLFQGLLAVGTLLLSSADLAGWAWLLGLAAAIRPWLEILFAALTGMFVSTWVRSAVVALAAAYTAVVLFRLLNNSITWLVLSGVVGSDNTAAVAGMSLGPTAVYAIVTGALWFGLLRRANTMEHY